MVTQFQGIPSGVALGTNSPEGGGGDPWVLVLYQEDWDSGDPWVLVLYQEDWDSGDPWVLVLYQEDWDSGNPSRWRLNSREFPAV